jgi:hypothetical protein
MEERLYMARAIFSQELGDPDFQWLISNYVEQRNATALVDLPCLPIVLLVITPQEQETVANQAPLMEPPPPVVLGAPENAENSIEDSGVE